MILFSLSVFLHSAPSDLFSLNLKSAAIEIEIEIEKVRRILVPLLLCSLYTRFEAIASQAGMKLSMYEFGTRTVKTVL